MSNSTHRVNVVKIEEILPHPNADTLGIVYIGGYQCVVKKDAYKVGDLALYIQPDTIVPAIPQFSFLWEGTEPTERKRRINELLEYVELTEYADRMINTLSGGMKKRAQIVSSLLHEPKVLFLDEPTVGLDTQGRRRLWDLVRRLNLDGTTIFLTTHYIEEAEVLCGRVGIMHHGRLIALDTPLALRETVGSVVVESLVDKETHYRIFANRAAANKYVQTLSSDARTVTIRDSNLEDVFVELTGQKVGDA